MAYKAEIKEYSIVASENSKKGNLHTLSENVNLLISCQSYRIQQNYNLIFS